MIRCDIMDGILEKYSIEVYNNSEFTTVKYKDFVNGDPKTKNILNRYLKYTPSNIINVDQLLTNQTQLIHDEFCKGVVIDQFMQETRKIWTENQHTGSQCAGLESYTLLNSIMAAAIQADQSF